MQSSKTPANKSEPVSGLMKKYKRTKMEKNKGQEESRRVKRRLRGDKTRTRGGQERGESGQQGDGEAGPKNYEAKAKTKIERETQPERSMASWTRLFAGE